MMPSRDPVRLHELRRLAYDELSEDAAIGLRARIASDPAAEERLRAVADHQRQPAGDPEAFADAILDRMARPNAEVVGIADAVSGRWASAARWSAAAVAASLAAFTLLPLLERTPHPGGRVDRPTEASPPRHTRTKGALDSARAAATHCAFAECPTLEMFVKDADGIRRGRDGMRLAPGDWIQFRYRGAGHRYVLIVSVDDDRVLSPLYPDHPGPSVPIEPDGRHILRGSVILDDALGPERFYAFFSRRPLTHAQVRHALNRIDDPTLQIEADRVRADVDQVSILIRKEAR